MLNIVQGITAPLFDWAFMLASIAALFVVVIVAAHMIAWLISKFNN